MDLNKYQFLYIQTMYDYFRENLQWPTFRQVEKKILPTHRDFRVLDVASSFEDNQAAHFFYQHLDVPATITLKEIRHYPEAEKDLADLAKVIRYCADKYVNSDEDQVTVTGEEVGRNLHFEEIAVRKVGLLLVLTSGIFTSFSNPEQSIWHLTASQNILDVEGIQSIDDYFERLDERIKSYQASRSSQNAASIMSQNYDTSATIEKIAQADPSDIKAIGVSALSLSTGYYNEPLTQSRQSFLLMRIAAVVCLLLFGAAFVILILQEPANLAYISMIGGAISALFSGIFFLMYRHTSGQALAYKPQVDRTQNFIVAISACEIMDEERKQRSREEIIRWFVGLQPNRSEDKK